MPALDLYLPPTPELPKSPPSESTQQCTIHSSIVSAKRIRPLGSTHWRKKHVLNPSNWLGRWHWPLTTPHLLSILPLLVPHSNNWEKYTSSRRIITTHCNVFYHAFNCYGRAKVWKRCFSAGKFGFFTFEDAEVHGGKQLFETMLEVVSTKW